jgi:predicted acyl esterase
LEKNTPWGIPWITHFLDDEFYTGQSLQPDYSRIKVPTMLWSGWADCYPTQILRAFSRLSVPKKVFLGPWGHDWPEMALPGPRIDFRGEMLKWYDRWLKGIDNGVTDEPPVTLFVRTYLPPNEMMPIDDAGEWRAEMEWVPERVSLQPMYFGDEGKLEHLPGVAAAQDSYEYDPTVGVSAGIYWGGGLIPLGMPRDQRADEAKSLTFTTPPLEQDTELLGGPKAVLYVSSTANVGYFHVKITDVAPDGTSKWVSDGGLLTSHRNSHGKPEPIVPGEVYELTIDLHYLAYKFQKGHRIRIAVASADLQNGWACGAPATHTLHRGGNHASHILLPIAPAQQPALPPPDLKPSPRPAPSADDFTGIKHNIIHDLVNDAVIVELERESGALPNSTSSKPTFGESEIRRLAKSKLTVFRKNPAGSTLEGHHVYTITRPEGVTRVEANEYLTSDAQMFRFQSRVEITVDGRSFFNKSWNVSRPRLLD